MGEEVLDTGKRLKLLAVSSGGGHWAELLRLQPAFGEVEVSFATTNSEYRYEVKHGRFYVIPYANKSRYFALLWSAVVVFSVILRERPDVIISTGAAPGYLALRIGKIFGARTIWVDSIANADELSLSGKKVGAYADLWLTQWPHLAQSSGPIFRGNVL